MRRRLGRLRPDTPRPTHGEQVVLARLTEGEDPRLQALRRQFDRAPRIIRDYPAIGSYVAKPYAVFDADKFPLEVRRLESSWYTVREASSARELDFRLVLGQHGFLLGLEGRTVDGREWPRAWDVEETEGSSASPIVLPSLEQQLAFQGQTRARLGQWVGVEIPDSVEMRPPPSDAAVALRELAIGGAYPRDYRDLLAITDGIWSVDRYIHGLDDAYPLDGLGFAGIVIEWRSDNTDDFVVVLALGGSDSTVYRMNIHDDLPKPIPVADNLRDYLRSSLG